MSAIDLASKAELIELTEARSKSGVRAMLQRMGVRFVVGRSGWPKVSRAQLRRLVDAEPVELSGEPDFSALDR